MKQNIKLHLKFKVINISPRKKNTAITSDLDTSKAYNRVLVSPKVLYKVRRYSKAINGLTLSVLYNR